VLRNHSITTVQSCSFDGHNWGRDLPSQVRSRSRVFTYQLSAFVIAPVTGQSCWAVWCAVHPLFVAVGRPDVWFVTRIITLTTKSTALACRYPLAARKTDLLTIDRIRDPPTATGAEMSRGPFINALNRQARVFYAFNSMPCYRALAGE